MTAHRAILGGAGAATLIGLACLNFTSDLAVFCQNNPSHPSCDAGIELDAGACDPSAMAEVASGFFVRPSGSDSFPGTASQPFATVQRGVAAAAASSTKKNVYLASDTFAESVRVDVGAAGVVVEGAWDQLNLWTKRCPPARRTLSVINSPTAVALEVRDVQGTAVTFKDLTLNTKAQGDSDAGEPGESLYAVRVFDSLVAFRNVSLNALSAGAGGQAATAPQTNNSTCVRSYPGDCGLSGAAGAAGFPGSPGSIGGPATAGQFGDAGWNAGAGSAGLDGGVGANGNVGSAPEVSSACATACTGACGTCGAATSSTTMSGSWGNCGCGGLGGRGGAGGMGGGAAVALMVVGAGSVVQLDAVELTTLAGGDGSEGGLGGLGGDGTNGTAGNPGYCFDINQLTYCSNGNSPCTYCAVTNGTLITMLGSGQGGHGGDGGTGGQGGGGAGGLSIGLVTVGAPTITGVNVTTTPGPGGSGAGGAPSGLSAQRVDN